jgi:hypothetical protein
MATQRSSLTIAELKKQQKDLIKQLGQQTRRANREETRTLTPGVGDRRRTAQADEERRRILRDLQRVKSALKRRTGR